MWECKKLFSPYGTQNTKRVDVGPRLSYFAFLPLSLSPCFSVSLSLSLPLPLPVLFPSLLRGREARGKSWRLVIKRGYKRYIEALAIIDNTWTAMPIAQGLFPAC